MSEWLVGCVVCQSGHTDPINMASLDQILYSDSVQSFLDQSRTELWITIEIVLPVYAVASVTVHVGASFGQERTYARVCVCVCVLTRTHVRAGAVHETRIE